MTLDYLVDLLWMLAMAVILVPLFQASRLGAVPGFLVAGLLVGPAGFGLVDNVQEIVHFAEIGVMLLLFVIGIELKPSRLWLLRRQVFGLGSAQVLLTGLILAAAAYGLFGLPLRSAALIGPALALSSTAFVLQILSEQRALTRPYGRSSLAVLLLQDLAVVPLLVLVPLLASPGLNLSQDLGLALLESLAILVVVIGAGRYFLHPLLHRVASAGSPELFTASALLIVLGAAVATEHAGLSMAMGAFLAGLLMSESAYRHQVLAEIQPFRGLFLGMFFMSMGMVINLDQLWAQPFTAVGLTVMLIVVKAAILMALARLSGLSTRTAGTVSLLLAQSGEFALILFALGSQVGLLPDEVFQPLLLVVLLSMLFTPFLARLAFRLQTNRVARHADADVEVADRVAPVILAGFGRVGRRIGDILTNAGISFVALDNDPSLVARERARGNPVFFGDLTRPGVLQSVGVAEARMIIVTLNDAHLTRDLVTTLCDQHPTVQIFARGHNTETCQALSRMGIRGVVSENVEASLELSRMVMEGFELDAQHRERVLDSCRKRYRKELHD